MEVEVVRDALKKEGEGKSTGGMHRRLQDAAVRKEAGGEEDIASLREKVKALEEWAGASALAKAEAVERAVKLQEEVREG